MSDDNLFISRATARPWSSAETSEGSQELVPRSGTDTLERSVGSVLRLPEGALDSGQIDIERDDETGPIARSSQEKPSLVARSPGDPAPIAPIREQQLDDLAGKQRQRLRLFGAREQVVRFRPKAPKLPSFLQK